MGPFDLRGKVALVTGGNRGIGLAIAEALARAGADVAIWGTNAARNEAALMRLRAHGTRVVAAQVDVSDEAAVTRQMQALLTRWGRIDAVIANAGVGVMPKPFVQQALEEWRAVFAVNLEGAFLTLREAARHMQARAIAGEPGGSLIAVASLAGTEAPGYLESYGATKAGVIAMTKGIAVEMARHGIRANAVLPGWIATDMTEQLRAAPSAQEKLLPRIPMRRWGEPADFGGIAVYLASDASRYHTGDTLVIDGGYAIF